MLSWVARFLLFFAGVIAGWFVPKDAPNYEVVQMIIGIFLLVAIVVIAVYWKRIKAAAEGKEPPEDE